MIYTNCLPFLIIKALRAAPGPASARDLAEVLNWNIGHIHNVLPDLIRSGHLVRTGSRKRYVYSLAVGQDLPMVEETPEHYADVQTTDANHARLQLLERKLAALKDEDAPVSPVRCEE